MKDPQEPVPNVFQRSMHSNESQILSCNEKSNTDCESFHEKTDLCSIVALKSASIEYIECIRSPFFLINNYSKTIQQKIDDESKIDLITHHRLLQPTEHDYKQLENQVIALITDETIEISKFTMLDRLYQYYQDDQSVLATIHGFAKEYQPTDAVYWFTKDTFIYRFINQLLRSGDIELFHNMRFYIAQLSTQLAELKYKQKDLMNGVKVVFRGLRQSTQEIEALKKLIGSIIVMKSFTSTSWDKNVALFFAGIDQPQSAESQPLLLELTADFSSPSVIAADISHLSSFAEEREVLFDIATEFRVEMLTFDSLNCIWLCRLFAPTELFSFTDLLTNRSTKINTSINKEIAVDKEMRYERRQKFDSTTNRPKQNELWSVQRTLPWMVSTPTDLVRIWQQIGIRSWQQGDMDRVKIYINRVAVFYEHESVDQHELARFFAFRSLFLYKIGEYAQAIDFAERSIAMSLRLPTSDPLILARYYRILGHAYLVVKRVKDALICFNQALISDENVPSTAKWSMVLTLRDIALIHRSRGDTTRAAEYFMKAWTVFREVSEELLESR